MPSFLYGKYAIQSASVEKYSSRLNPYQDGLFAGPAEIATFEFTTPAACAGNASLASGKGSAASDPAAAAFSTWRREGRSLTESSKFVGLVPFPFLLAMQSSP